jgi:hypothetical protein
MKDVFVFGLTPIVCRICSMSVPLTVTLVGT